MANRWTSGHVVRPVCERWLGCVTDVWSCISGLTPLSPRACRWLASPALSQVCVCQTCVWAGCLGRDLTP